MAGIAWIIGSATVISVTARCIERRWKKTRTYLELAPQNPPRLDGESWLGGDQS